MPLIIVHSPKGGVGTTTMVANLASWLARGGRPVLAVDLSPHDSLSLHLQRDLAPADPRQGANDGPATGQVRLATRAGGLGIEQLLQEAERAAQGDALVLVDIPAGETGMLHRLAPRAIIHLCVLAADAGSVAMLPGLMNDRSGPADAPRLHYVLNRMDDRRSVAREVHRVVRLAVMEDLVAVVRSDEALNESLAALTSIYDHAPASAAAADIAALADRIAASLTVRQPEPQRQDEAA